MKAVRLFHDKATLPDGSIVEMSVWRIPSADSERPHGLKYSLYFGRDGTRIVGYDKERGKGDYKRIDGRESQYRFISVEKLISDFLSDVERTRVRQQNVKE